MERRGTGRGCDGSGRTVKLNTMKHCRTVVLLAASAAFGAAPDPRRCDLPAFRGNLYCQWLIVAPGRNGLGLEATSGLAVQVR